MNNPVNPVNPVQDIVLFFDYDALGHRVRKIDAVAGQTTLYYNDPEWRVLAEYDAANNQLRKYIYGNYLDETLRMTDTYAGDGTPTGDYYFLQDHLYSPAVLLSSAGAVFERYEFDAYGTRHVLDQNFGTRANTNYGIFVAFQGHIHDRLDNGNLNLLDARYRTYDPFAGRWLMHEKLGMIPNSDIMANPFQPFNQFSEGMNLFLALNANPIVSIDPMGLLWFVERNGGSYAQATVLMSADTVSKLASTIGLESGQFRKWLTLIDDPIQTSSGKKSLSQLQANDNICPNQRVNVPNMIIAYWGGWGDGDPLWGGIGKHWVDWDSDVRTFSTRGFQVYEIESLTASGLEETILSYMVFKQLHGIFAWGHGNVTEFLTVENMGRDPAYYSEYRNWMPIYKMGLGIIWACHSGDGFARRSFSSNGIFRGAQGTLIPWPFHLFGPTVAEIVPPGAQETRR